MKRAWFVGAALCLVLFPGPGSAQESAKARGLYLRVFDSQAWTPYGGEERTCDERTDLVLIGGSEGIPIPPTDYAFIRQYDPILSTSVLCHPAMEGFSRPVAEYTNFPGDVLAEARNSDGTPLQTYGVKAFCEYDLFGEVSRLAPARVILLCVGHRALPP